MDRHRGYPRDPYQPQWGHSGAGPSSSRYDGPAGPQRRDYRGEGSNQAASYRPPQQRPPRNAPAGPAAAMQAPPKRAEDVQPNEMDTKPSLPGPFRRNTATKVLSAPPMIAPARPKSTFNLASAATAGPSSARRPYTPSAPPRRGPQPYERAQKPPHRLPPKPSFAPSPSSTSSNPLPAAPAWLTGQVQASSSATPMSSTDEAASDAGPSSSSRPSKKAKVEKKTKSEKQKAKANRKAASASLAVSDPSPRSSVDSPAPQSVASEASHDLPRKKIKVKVKKSQSQPIKKEAEPDPTPVPVPIPPTPQHSSTDDLSHLSKTQRKKERRRRRQAQEAAAAQSSSASCTTTPALEAATVEVKQEPGVNGDDTPHQQPTPALDAPVAEVKQEPGLNGDDAPHQQPTPMQVDDEVAAREAQKQDGRARSEPDDAAETVVAFPCSRSRPGTASSATEEQHRTAEPMRPASPARPATPPPPTTPPQIELSDVFFSDGWSPSTPPLAAKGDDGREREPETSAGAPTTQASASSPPTKAPAVAGSSQSLRLAPWHRHERISFGRGQNISFNWLASMRSQSSGLYALFAVSTLGKTSICWAGNEGEDDDDLPLALRSRNCQLSTLPASVRPRDVRRLSTHAVAVATSSKDGSGSQVTLAFAREKDRDELDDELEPNDVHASLTTLAPRPHSFGGATSIAPFLPSDDGSLSFITGGADGIVQAWSYRKGKTETTTLDVQKHRSAIYALETLPSIDLVLSASRAQRHGTDLMAFDGRTSQMLRFWTSSDPASKLTRTRVPHLIDVASLRADYDQHKLYDLRAAQQPVASFGWLDTSTPTTLGRPAFHAHYCFQGCPDGKMRMWDMRMLHDVLNEGSVGEDSVSPLTDSVWSKDGGESGGGKGKSGSNGSGSGSSGGGSIIALAGPRAWRVPLDVHAKV